MPAITYVFVGRHGESVATPLIYGLVALAIVLVARRRSANKAKPPGL